MSLESGQGGGAPRAEQASYAPGCRHTGAGRSGLPWKKARLAGLSGPASADRAGTDKRRDSSSLRAPHFANARPAALFSRNKRKHPGERLWVENSYRGAVRGRRAIAGGPPPHRVAGSEDVTSSIPPPWPKNVNT